jgi:hypothetical protein
MERLRMAISLRFDLAFEFQALPWGPFLFLFNDEDEGFPA